MYEKAKKEGGIGSSLKISDKIERLAKHMEKIEKELVTGRSVEYFKEKLQ